MGLYRKFWVVCDGCGVCGPEASSENDAYSFAAAERPHIFKSKGGAKVLRDLCHACRQHPELISDSKAGSLRSSVQPAPAAAISERTPAEIRKAEGGTQKAEGSGQKAGTDAGAEIEALPDIPLRNAGTAALPFLDGADVPIRHRRRSIEQIELNFTSPDSPDVEEFPLHERAEVFDRRAQFLRSEE